MTEIINMQNVCKSYRMGDEDIEVLHNVNLMVHSGEFVSILGPSGSGKSTLMNIIGCLDVATSGQYFLSGNNIEELKESELAYVRNKEIGFVFQSFQLLPRLNALQNVEIPLIYRGVPRSLRRKLAMEILEKVGLKDRMHHLPN